MSRTYASVFPRETHSGSGASGIFPDPSSADPIQQNIPEKQQELSGEQLHPRLSEGESGIEDELAENTLLALVRARIENDFETVVFLQYTHLREIKRHLMGSLEAESSALIAALSGSGSALFGLYRSKPDACAAHQRLQQAGVQALVTSTLPRPIYWSSMFAE